MTQSADFTHFSQLLTYKKCRHKHDLAYLERLEPSTANPAMLFGTLGHARLADLFLGTSKHSDEAVARAREDFPDLKEREDLISEAQRVADWHFPALEKRFAPATHDSHPLVEYSLLTDVNGKPFGGTPDMVAVDKEDGSVWVLDWKFRSSFLPPDSELLNLQMIVYIKLLRMKGIDVAGSRQVQIRPYLPKQPKVNKDGSVSKAACQTDWLTYAKAVLMAGGNPGEYLDMKAKLDGVTFIDVDSCKTLRSEQEIDFFWDNECLPALKEIQERKTPKPGGRIFDQMTCRGCQYRDLCVEEAKGGDVSWMKENLFQIKGTKRRALEVVFEDD